MSDVFLSVVIPAYNEEGNFKKGPLGQVERYLQKQKYSWEVIIVDDGSRDKTVKLVNSFIKNRSNWHLVENPHQGKAQTVVTGILGANGENIIFTDFDQATPLPEVEKLLKKRKEGFDVIIGSREIKGAKREKEPFYRHLMGRVFNFFVQLLILPGIHDTQCGFKLFSQSAAQKIFPCLLVYKKRKIADAYTGAFDVEALFLARRLGFKIAEVPIYWHHVKTTRVNPIKDSIRMFVDIVKIRLMDLFGAYGEK